MSSFNENRLYAEIECLKQRNAELAAQAEEVAKALQDKQIIIDHLKGELMRALSQYDMAAAHNVELKAQVELMRKITDCFHIDPDGIGVIMKDADGAVFRGILPLLNDASQCLAEHDREVAARSAKAAFVAGFTYCYEQDCEPLAGLAESANYANKIKSGEVKV